MNAVLLQCHSRKWEVPAFDRDAGSTRKEVSKGNSCSADLEGSTRHNGGRELVLSFCSPEALLFKLTRLKLLVPKDT